MNVVNSNKIELLPSVLVSIGVFIVFIFLGTMLPKEISDASTAQVKEMVSQLEGIGPFALLVAVFLDNTLKCLIVIMTGVILGLPPVVYIGINASLLGILISNSQNIQPIMLFAGLGPHGIIEIPAFLFSAALGIAIGRQVFKFLMRQESSARLHLSYALNFFYRWIVPALLLASIIEVFVTPVIIAAVGGNGSPVMVP